MNILFAEYSLFVKYNGGTALLSALCKQKGINTDLCFLTTVSEFFQKLRNTHYDYICFSATVRDQYLRMLPFARIARDTGHKILLGGTWCGLMQTVEEDLFDAVCRGEGETLPDFLLSWDTKLFKTQMIHRDLNTLPIPDYDLFKDFPFVRGVKFMDEKKVLPYSSSRGCVGKCTFCQVRHQPYLRVRTKVARDLKEITEKYKPDMIYISDCLMPYWSKRWCGSWMDFRYPFVGLIRADIEPNVLKWLIDRGLQGTLFGVESGDEQYRNKVLKKGITDEQVWRTIDILDKHKIQLGATFMFDTPGERFLHKTKTAEMMNKIGRERTLILQFEDLKQWQAQAQ